MIKKQKQTNKKNRGQGSQQIGLITKKKLKSAKPKKLPSNSFAWEENDIKTSCKFNTY